MEEQHLSKKTLASEVLISVFVCLYFLTVLVWLTPESVFKSRYFSQLYNPWLFFGLSQSWALFSPNIREINYYPSAIITFQDGSKTLWEPPLMDKLTLIERFQKEKFRKWSIDSLPWPRFDNYREDFARYVGRQVYNPANKPVSIALNLRWIEIPKPIEPLLGQGDLPPKTKFNTTFCYLYKGEDFQ